jgi:hypothetical protein
MNFLNSCKFFDFSKKIKITVKGTTKMVYTTDNPIYLLIGFLIFYYFIAQPFFNFDLIRSVLLFIVLYFIYTKYGDKIFERVKSQSSSFGRRR